MNKQIMIDLLRKLQNAFPGARLEDREGMLDLWTEKLSRYADEVVTEAVELLIDEGSHYFPALPEVIQRCNQLVMVRVQCLQNEHARIKYAPFDEKAWRELIAGYTRYGWLANADTARQDMEHARNGFVQMTPEKVRQMIDDVTGKLSMKDEIKA